MKYYFLGIFTMLFVNFAAHFLWLYGLDNDNEKLSSAAFNIIYMSDYVTHPLTNRCNENLTIRGIPQTEYFKCDYLQTKVNSLFFGE